MEDDNPFARGGAGAALTRKLPVWQFKVYPEDNKTYKNRTDAKNDFTNFDS